jgi:hypothetical protein
MKNIITLIALLFCCSATLLAQKPMFESTLKNLTGWSNLDKSSKKSGDKWATSKVGPTGAFKIPKIKSTTAADGFALFDSDTKCSNSQNAWLITPAINCSNQPTVYLTFQQTYRRFVDTCWVNISGDNGTTWTKIPINQQYDNNQGPKDNPEVVEMDISDVAANKAQVKVAFQFGSDAPGTDAGCGYSWMIDDVKVTPKPNNNLVMTDFFFPLSSLVTPASQIGDDTLQFFVKVKNAGAKNQTNVNFKVTIQDTLGKIYYSDSTVLANVATDIQSTADSFLFLENRYEPKLAAGVYVIRYSLFSKDSTDFSPSNNVKSQFFVVSEDEFAKEFGNTANADAFQPGGSGDYAVGNYYKTTKYFGNNAFKATEIKFSCASNTALEGNTVNTYLFQIDKEQVAFDFSDFNEATGLNDNPQLQLLSLNTLTFTAGDKSLDLFTLPLIDVDAKPDVKLEANSRYFLMCSYTDASAENLFQAFQQDASYNFQTSTILHNGGTWFLGGFGPELNAVVRMIISMSLVDTKETTLPEATLAINPNPASEFIKLDIKFDAPTDALIAISDITGKVIYMKEHKGMSQEGIVHDVSDYANGTYFVKIATETGTKTRKFVVQH